MITAEQWEQWKNLSKHKAKEILKEVQGPLFKPPILIKKVITAYLGDVIIMSSCDRDFPEGVSAFSQKDMDLGWFIIVNGKESIERQRFSAAHELGHIVLIQNQPSRVFCSNEKDSWIEKLCDRFAGDILMPDEAIMDLYRSSPSICLEEMASVFRVSNQVAEIQMEHLGVPFRRIRAIF